MQVADDTVVWARAPPYFSPGKLLSPGASGHGGAAGISVKVIEPGNWALGVGVLEATPVIPRLSPLIV